MDYHIFEIINYVITTKRVIYHEHYSCHRNYYRGMEFIQIFIKDVAEGEQSLDVAAGKAYSKSLRRFHNWIVRGVFNVSTTMQIW
jgi:hypothetical protein